MAIEFAKLGANVCIVGRNAERLQKTFDECQQNKIIVEQKVVQFVFDISKEADAERLVKETIEQLGQLDVLVNNAGVLEYGSIESTTLEQYDRVMNINLRAVYHLTMLSVPHLVQTKGFLLLPFDFNKKIYLIP